MPASAGTLADTRIDEEAQRMITLLDGAMGDRAGASRRLDGAAPVVGPGAARGTGTRSWGVHRDHISAGADVITTNTYSTVPSYLEKSGEQGRYAELTRMAGELARRAADESECEIRVAGSLPPLSESYRADLVPSEEEAAPIYRTMADGPSSPYVDLFLCETMSSATEAKTAATQAVRTASKRRLPVMVSWTLDETPGAGLRSGESVGEACAAPRRGSTSPASSSTALSQRRSKAALPQLREVTDRPVGCYANRPQESAGGMDSRR